MGFTRYLCLFGNIEERLWLEKHPSKSEYRWTYNIHLQLKAANAEKPTKKKKILTNQPMIIDLNSRLELYNFLQKPETRKLTAIKKAFVGLLTEENVDAEHNDHLLMALLDVKSQSRIPMEKWPQNSFPTKSFREIMIEYNHLARKFHGVA